MGSFFFSLTDKICFKHDKSYLSTTSLDNQLREVTQNGWSYIKDSNDFIKKIKHLKNIPDNAILVTADVVGLYPSIPHEAGLRALKEVLDRRKEKKISTEDLC